jgi:hypothetical protein
LVRTSGRRSAGPTTALVPLLVALLAQLAVLAFVWSTGGPGVSSLRDVVPITALAAWGFVTIAWLWARRRGLVSRSSGAGLSLALFALAAWSWCRFVYEMMGMEAVLAAYAWPDSKSGLVWVHRNVMPMAFGYGVGLTFFASMLDVRRRQNDPRWVLGAD